MYNVRMLFKYILTLFIILLLNAKANSQERINLQLDWLHQFQFAGYYIAKEKGYYSDNNLDVNIKEFDYNTKLLDNVLQNDNTYSVGKSSLIIDRLQGHKIVLLNAIYQNSPMVLISLKNSNIKTINDFKSKKIMLTSDARSAASINSMIMAEGLKTNDVDFIPHSFKLEDLISGKTDLIGSYLSNEPYILKNMGIEFDIFDPRDYGFDFYGGILFTSEKELKHNPIRVKKFTEASLRGWDYAFENIEETAKLIYDKYNTQNKSLKSLIYEGNILKKLAKYNEGNLGNIDKKKILEMKRLYLVLGFKKVHDLEIEEFIYNKKSIFLTNEERTFLKSKNFTLISNSKNMPYSFKIQNQLNGLEIDYWKLLEKKLNRNFNIIEYPPSQKILESIQTNDRLFQINYNKNDIDISKTSLSKPITKISMAIATKNNNNLITDLSLIRNKKIALIEKNNIYYNLKKNYPNIDFVKVDTLDKAINMLEKEEIYGVIDNILSLSYNIIKMKYNHIKVSGTLPYEMEIRLSSSKENQIAIDILNKIIEQIPQDEKDLIEHKYQLILYQEVNDHSWIYKYILPLFIIIIIILIVNSKMRKEIKKRKIAEKALIDYANKDSLTKVFNRRKIEKIMTSQIKKAKETNSTFSIVFLDIDDFKNINDTLGHIKGDHVLVSISKLVSKHIRTSDYIGRWGGEEFIVILPNTNEKQAEKVALFLKDLITNKDFKIDKPLTSSFGVTEYKNNDTKADIIKRADKAMYFVKENGKNDIKVL